MKTSNLKIYGISFDQSPKVDTIILLSQIFMNFRLKVFFDLTIRNMQLLEIYVFVSD